MEKSSSCSAALDVVSGRFWRHCVASFIHNFSGFYYWTLLPLVASEMGASSSVLAVLSALNSVLYSILSVLCGVLGLRAVNSGWVLRTAVSVFVLSCLIALRSSSGMYIFFISAVVMAFSRGVYWTIIQTAVGLEAPPERKNFFISVFSSSWSVGKSVGFLVGGYLKGALGVTTSWVFVMIFCATQLVILPGVFPCTWRARILPPTRKGELLPEDKDAENGDEESVASPAAAVAEHPGSEDDSAVPKVIRNDSAWESFKQYVKRIFSEDEPLSDPIADRDKSMVYLFQCWLMNFYMNGMMSTIVSLFLKYAKYYKISFRHAKSTSAVHSAVSSAVAWVYSSSSDSEAEAEKSAIEIFIGIFLCMLFIWQTTLFFMLSKLKWGRRRALLYFAETLPVAGLILITLTHDPVALIFISSLCGFGGGFGILLSLSASLRCSGAAVGINEAILALGGSVLPLVAGATADISGDPRAAYWITAVFAFAVALCQEIVEHVGPTVLRTLRRRDEKRKQLAGAGEYVLMDTFSKSKPAAVSSEIPSALSFGL